MVSQQQRSDVGSLFRLDHATFFRGKGHLACNLSCMVVFVCASQTEPVVHV